MYVCAPVSTWFLLRLEEGIRCPGTGVRNSCGPHVGAKDSNPHPLQEQSVVVVTEPSLRCRISMLMYLKTIGFLFILHAIYLVLFIKYFSVLANLSFLLSLFSKKTLCFGVFYIYEFSYWKIFYFFS